MSSDGTNPELFTINPERALALSREDYLTEMFSLPQIEARWGVPRKILANHAIRSHKNCLCWSDELAQYKESVIEEAKALAAVRRDVLKPHLQTIMTMGADIITRTLTEMQREGITLSVNQLPKFVAFLDRIDQWVRLNENSPTAIIGAQNIPVTEEEIRAELQKFAKGDQEFVAWDKTETVEVLPVPPVVPDKEDLN